jgi:hypothetical protein
MDDKLLCNVDCYAASNFMSRSGVIGLACNKLLQDNAVANALVSLSAAMQKIAESNTIDEETKVLLADVEAVARLLKG